MYVFGGDSANYAPLAQKYDPAGDTWSPLAPLPSGRTFASAVTDGAAIYILNGDTSSYGSAFLARYDPAANPYTALATPPHATAAQAAVYLNGRIYRIAGVTGFSETPVNTVDVYTIATNTWASAAAYPQAVGGLFAVAANGRIAAGGAGRRRAPIPPKPTSTTPPRTPGTTRRCPTWQTGRHYSATGVLHGRWIVAGGRESGGIVPTAWALDLSNPAGGWTALPDLENLYPGPGGAATADAFYIFGGDVNQPRAAERYEENLCATPVGHTLGHPLRGRRLGRARPAPAALQGSAAAAQDGRVYLFGGVGDSGLPGASAFAYTAGANTWQALAPLPEPRSYAGVVSDGAYLYIVNGLGPNGAQQNTVWRYDPATNSYTSLAPAPLATHAQAVALLDGRIYRVAGNGPGSNPTSTVDVFTIATNSWAPAGSVAPYPVAIAGLSAVGANGAVWAGGGGFPQSAKTYRYDPVANAWNDGAIRDLPAGRAASAGGLLGARWLLAGGDLYTQSPTTSAVALDLNNPTGLWQNLAPLPHARRLAAGAADGASLYVLGGGPPAGADTQRYTDGGCGAPSPTPTACPAGQFSDVHTSGLFLYARCNTSSATAWCRATPIARSGLTTIRPARQMVKIVTLGFAIPIQTPAGGELHVRGRAAQPAVLPLHRDGGGAQRHQRLCLWRLR